ncbi:hypothetical protein ADK86_02095 [Streptomyces sp. NRRL F-5755]|nr:hypothetical protein ADK86_02095 [Streptomyces sp. NRRL F-5755]
MHQVLGESQVGISRQQADREIVRGIGMRSLGRGVQGEAISSCPHQKMTRRLLLAHAGYAPTM